MSSADTRTLPDPDWVLEALRVHEGPLLRYAASLVGAAGAQDVVQDAFLRLCAQPFEKVEGHIAAWLFTVARNRAIEIRRSERRLTPMQEDDMLENPDSGPATKLERAEKMSRVGAAMAALPDRHREALLLKIDGGLSYKQIADVMNLTVGNVGFILHAAIAQIRETLAGQEPAARDGRTP